jgi:xanthine dehydrogenase accessory factor
VSEFGLPETVRLARQALEGGPRVTLAVVVAASDPALVGRRLAWDGERLHGDLGDEARTEEAAALLRAGREVAGCHEIDGGVELYVERIEPPAELVIVGAGHIAQPLAGIGKLLGLRVTVLDDRPEFATRERFPDADQVIVVDFDDPLAGIEVGPRTSLVLVTRGHRHDYDCLRVLARTADEPAYVGMIGSRRRVRAAFEQLAAEGLDASWLARIHAPLGLDIGAETPAEIAIAVAAEIVLVARGGTGRPLSERAGILRHVRSLAGTSPGRGEAP